VSIVTRCITSLTLLIVMGWAIPTAQAHYNMLLPDKPSVKKGETVTFTYQWGHPFEHELFDAPKPERLVVLAPNGKRSDLTKALERITVPARADKKVIAYQFKFTPEQRGDYIFLLQTPPIWMQEEGIYLEDIVKVVLHVQAQKGWDAKSEREFELLPLTRPYGLQAGMVFQAQILLPPRIREKSVDSPVEIERYNASAPVSLPPDEHITRKVKPDPNGIVTATLTEMGWWGVTASRDGGQVSRDGKRVWKTLRTTLWVFVDDRPPKK
jgi:cobalt/nickel transport protein